MEVELVINFEQASTVHLFALWNKDIVMGHVIEAGEAEPSLTFI